MIYNLLKAHAHGVTQSPVQNASDILSIISSLLNIIILLVGIVLYNKYLVEHKEKKRIDAYYGFYSILRRQLHWLKSSLQVNGNYALASYMKDDTSGGRVSCGSDGLTNRYEMSREVIINLICSAENQYSLKNKNDDFQDNLNKLVLEYLLVYYKDAPNKKLIENITELASKTDQMNQLIENLISIIDNNQC